MANRDFESLIKTGQSLYDTSLAEIEKKLGKEYRKAYESAKLELQALFLAMEDGVSTQEANKYNRLTKTLKAIDDNLKAVTNKATSMTYSEMEQAYQDSYYGLTWATEQATYKDKVAGAAVVIGLWLASLKKKDPTWGKVSVKEVQELLEASPGGLPPIKTLKKHLDLLQWEMEGIVRRNIATATSSGQAYRKTAKELEKLFTKGYNQALVVVRTESGRMFSEGFLDAHNKAVSAGIELQKRWVATLDGRTRDTHAFLDGKLADKDGWFYSSGAKAQAPHLFGVASEDINCRCDVTDELEGFPPELRRYDGDINPYVTFKDWAGERGWTEVNGWPKLKSKQ